MKKALITGIAGFTGSHLCEYLFNLGLKIYGLDISFIESLEIKLRRRIVKYYQVDIRDEGAIKNIIHSIKPDYIFHLAGLVGEEKLEKLLEINVIGTKNVLEGIRVIKSRVLIPGSAAEYGIVPQEKLPVSEDSDLNPVNFYGISKLTQIKVGYYYLNYDCPVYLARPFNISGPKEPPHLVCGSIAKNIVNIKRKNLEPIITVGNLRSRRDFVDVRDVVKGYWEIINKGRPGEVYNICSGTSYSIREIIDLFSEIAQIKLKVRQSHKLTRKFDIPIMVGDNTKIKKETGWKPKIKFERTLRDLLNFYQKLYD